MMPKSFANGQSCNNLAADLISLFAQRHFRTRSLSPALPPPFVPSSMVVGRSFTELSFGQQRPSVRCDVRTRGRACEICACVFHITVCIWPLWSKERTLNYFFTCIRQYCMRQKSLITLEWLIWRKFFLPYGKWQNLLTLLQSLTVAFRPSSSYLFYFYLFVTLNLDCVCLLVCCNVCLSGVELLQMFFQCSSPANGK